MKALFTTLALVAMTAGAVAQSVQPLTYDEEPPVATRDGANATVEQDGLDDGQATTRFEEAGYSNILNVEQGEDGFWRAQAEKDGATVDVMLDDEGKVTEATD
jgi:hypothetical protein